VRFIGFAAGVVLLGLFPCPKGALRKTNRPLSLTLGSFSHETVPLQSSYNVIRRPRAFRGEQPTWDFCPYRGITTARPLVRIASKSDEMRPLLTEPPRFRYGPSSGFLNLSTVCSVPQFAGLFHPAATSRVHACSGASPSLQPSYLIGRLLPPCRSNSTHSPAETSCREQNPSTSRPCSEERYVPPVWCYPRLRPLPSSG